MIFEQFYLECLSHASYLIGDPETGDAAVVDPQRDVDIYLDAARAHGLTVRHVILTHFHADFVSGHLELQEKTGATIHLGASARAAYATQPAHDGDLLQLGRVTLQFLETPGHTPEGISVVVREHETAEPYGVLTGDTLFVGDVGRPDLLASIGFTADELGHMLYHSLHDKLLKLPDATRIFPAHGAGSMCGKALGSERSSTLGEQRATNYALRPMTQEAFVALVTADQPLAPQYFVHDAILNREERKTLDEELRAARPFTAEQALEHLHRGGVLLDTRSADTFAHRHVPGSVNIGLDGKFATWAGSVVDPLAPVVVLADPGREFEAMTRLGRVGFEHVHGFVEHGIDAFTPTQTQSATRVRAGELAALRTRDAVTVVDVREPDEIALGAIPGSLHVSLKQLAQRVGDLPPKDRELVVHCAGGYRSSAAASLLRNLGWTVRDLEGGYASWQTANDDTAVINS